MLLRTKRRNLLGANQATACTHVCAAVDADVEGAVVAAEARVAEALAAEAVAAATAVVQRPSRARQQARVAAEDRGIWALDVVCAQACRALQAPPRLIPNNTVSQAGLTHVTDCLYGA